MTLKAFSWRGEAVDPVQLMKRYGVAITPAGPGPAMRVVSLVERYGRALLEVNIPAGNLVRMVIPGNDRAYPTDGGRFTIPLNTGDHTYYPLGDGRSGAKRGPFGFSVAGVASDYADGFGVAFGAYDDDPSQLPPASMGNAYGHLEPTFAWDAGTTAPSVPVTPPISDPTPITGGIWLTADEVQRLRGSLLNVDDILRTATNRPPTRTA